MQKDAAFYLGCGYDYPWWANLGGNVPCARCKGGFPVRSDIPRGKGAVSMNLLLKLWNEDQGQDIAEYAVMLAVILVIVVGTVRLIGSNANTVFSSVASAIQ